MGVTLERVQNKFACIIGELCSEPVILSQFAIWVDLRIAEYKARGAISLDCSGTSPDPTWLKGHIILPDRPSSREETPSLSHLPQETDLSFANSSPGGNVDPEYSISLSDRLSPDVVVVKQELTDSDRRCEMSNRLQRKRNSSSALDANASASKLSKLSSGSGLVLEPVNESLMSIIGESEESDLSRTIENLPQTNFSSSDSANSCLNYNNYNSAYQATSSSNPDGTENFNTEVIYQRDGATVVESREDYPTLSEEVINHLKELYPSTYPDDLCNNAIRQRIPFQEQKSRETIVHLVSAVATLERWMWKKYDETGKIETMEPSKLDTYLSEYFGIVRKQNGDDYDPASLGKLKSYLARYLREHNYQDDINKSPLFENTRRTLARRKQLLCSKHYAASLVL